MSLTGAQLFALLPAVYRTRDTANGGKLQGLFDIMAAQSGVVEQNIQQLYDDQFIETCAPWVIPYIGDLIGYNSIYQTSAGIDSRPEVANTIGYRRRKGTHIALEQVAMDVSGRAAVVVEEFKRLITTQSMRHVRPAHVATLNVRKAAALERLDTAFDSSNRTVDVRRIAPRVRTPSDPDPTPLEIALHGPGRFNVPDIAIYLWRWRSWFVTRAPAFALGNGRYLFSPLGNDVPLFSNPPARTSFERLTTRLDVPQPIRRTELARHIGDFYGPSIMLYVDDAPVDISQVYSANLADRPGGAWCTVAPGKICIDPELGRIQFAADLPLPRTLRVSYCYGLPAAIGGGPYDRSANLAQLDVSQADFFALVGSADYPTFESAVEKWNGAPPGTSGVIVLPDFESYAIDLTGTRAIQLPARSSLTLVCGKPIPAGGPRDVIWTDAWVTLTGNIEVVGVAGPSLPEGEAPVPGQLLVSGVRISGQLLVGGVAVALQIADTTLVPGIGLTRDGDPVTRGEPSILITAAQASLCLVRSICGSIAADSAVSTRVMSSIVDSTSPCCIAYAGPDLTSAGGDLHVEDSTLIGKVRTRTLPLASNTLFVARRSRRDPWPAAVWCSRQQVGCVRFCYLPFDSITPQRYLCLPREAADGAMFVPEFVTLRYGNPSYALLSGDVALGLWQGADNGSQIGAYGQIEETEAVHNVQIRAPEYLPVTFESGVFLLPSRPLPGPVPIPPAYGLQPVDCCNGTGTEEPLFVGVGAHLL
jgi:hypothetical protein